MDVRGFGGFWGRIGLLKGKGSVRDLQGLGF